MRNAHVLVINLGAIANEVVKNIVLAGIGSLTILDNHDVGPSDLGAQFLVNDEDLGKNRAEAARFRIQQLNPRVTLSVITDALDMVISNVQFVDDFDVIVATELKYSQYVALNRLTREKNKIFYAAGTFGLCGYVFADLIEYQFRIERDRPNVPTKCGPETKTRSIIEVSVRKEGTQHLEILTKVEKYASLEAGVQRSTDSSSPFSKGLNTRKQLKISPLLPALLAYWQSDRDPNEPFDISAESFKELVLNKTRELGLPAGIIRDEFVDLFVRGVGAEISPVSAIIGGVLGQEVLNVWGHKEQPIQNLFLFNGDTSDGPIYCLN